MHVKYVSSCMCVCLHEGGGVAASVIGFLWRWDVFPLNAEPSGRSHWEKNCRLWRQLHVISSWQTPQFVSENPDIAVCLCLFGSFHITGLKRSTADTSIFVGLLNRERLAMNSLRLLLIIINNASLPIYLSCTHTPLLLIVPTPAITHNPSPITHTSRTHALTSMHVIHTHQPPFPPYKYLFQLLISPSPSVLLHQLHPFAFFTSPIHPPPPPPPSSSLRCHPLLVVLSYPSDYSGEICIRQSMKTRAKGSEDFLGSNHREMLTKKKMDILFEIHSNLCADRQPSGYS